MKNNAKNINNGYIVDKEYSFVDLTTIKANEENKCYLIDKRLLDELLSKVTKGSLESIKEELHKTVHMSATKESLFNNLDEYIYLDKIVQMLEPLNYNTDNNIGMAADMIKESKTLHRED